MLYTVLALLFVFIALYFAAAYSCFRSAFLRRRTGEYTPGDLAKIKGLAPYMPRIEKGYAWLLAQDTARYSIVSFDGLKLYAKYLPAGNSKRLSLIHI